MQNPLVVGYRGEIGSFILSGLLRTMPKALNIWCVDIMETESEVTDRIKKSDVIFLCTPMNLTHSWLLKYKDHLQDKVIIEQCSLKSWLFDIPELAELDIRSMHILFRPSATPNKSDRTVILLKDQMDVSEVSNIQNITESEIVFYDSTIEHDQDMALQQALVHRTMTVLSDMLDKSKATTFLGKRIMEIGERIKQGDPALYSMIQNNAALPDVMQRMIMRLQFFGMAQIFKD